MVVFISSLCLDCASVIVRLCLDKVLKQYRTIACYCTGKLVYHKLSLAAIKQDI